LRTLTLDQGLQSHDHLTEQVAPSSKQPSHIGDSKKEVCTTGLSVRQEQRRHAIKTGSNQLCEECKGINFQDILDLDAAALQENLKEGLFIKNLGSGLEHAAKSLCSLCRLFSHARIIVDDLPDSPEYHLRAYSVFNRFNNMDLKSCSWKN
jgi:hypothetical protein